MEEERMEEGKGHIVDKFSFVRFILGELDNNRKHNKISIEKAAARYGVFDKTQVKEYTELAIVLKARTIALSKTSVEQRYAEIVKLYQNQVNLSHRTSQSILLQQYSTPAPIAFLAGIFVNADQNVTVFEPSAGNGLLTIAANPARVFVNEIDNLRRSNLYSQGFKYIGNQDATQPFTGFEKYFDSVITNPPFGILASPVKYETFGISTLDHLMALRALDCMKDDGKAAIIIGGHTRWDKKGRIQLGKNRIFFNYFYSRYNVVDMINVDGHKLYSRQGTSFDVRLILIDGRKAIPSGAAPISDPDRDKVVYSFDELYNRVINQTQPKKNGNNNLKDMRELELEAEALELELLLLNDVGLGIMPSSNGQGEEWENNSYPALYSLYKKIKPKYHQEILLLEKDQVLVTFNEDAVALARALNVQYANIRGYGAKFSVAGIFKGKLALYLPKLNKARTKFKIITKGKVVPQKEVPALLMKWLELLDPGLGMPYTPASEGCVILDTVVPDSMGYETHSALDRIKKAIGGDMDEYVRVKLNYKTQTELCKALSAEQIDAVAMAIYNIEERSQGMIIGDQTGIGKGRVAAAIIRYAVEQGTQPIFITEKANLFSDIYRDLVAIGSEKLVPFIVNGRESKTDIKDEDGNVVHQALPASEQERIFTEKSVPRRFDFIVATYSQFNSPEKKPTKPAFLLAIAEDNIIIMDEAHNSSGSGNTGNLMQSVLVRTKGVVFLSATFAKRVDNMPIYAMKTSISEASMTRDALVDAVLKGGVALQEILASQLVAEGQMLRRERSFEGVEVNYITLYDKEQEHKAISDNITEIIRFIIEFQGKHIDGVVEELDKMAVADGKQITVRGGTSEAGVDNLPYFSKVFNVINQMLFSIKAEAVAERAIMRLREGKKPVIAFASTMGSFVEQMENERGMPVSDGDVINADFSTVLQRGLDGVMRYTVTEPDGTKSFKNFDPSELSPEAREEYLRISEWIKSASTGITISPIDVIIQKITQAGYTVAEVTGRKYELQVNPKTYMALVKSRKRVNTNDAFRQFNNNEVDVLMINQSGSTGASAHAIVTPKVRKEQVKQRVMIVLQAELDISTEVQKRGRINRTGQIIKPIYDYVNSAIPAEQRLMMMLQKKLKSLDANTTSNQKSSTKILDVPDFLNKYGDKIVTEYLLENPIVNLLIDDPLNIKESKSEGDVAVSNEDGGRDGESAAHRVSGRVAVLSTKMQQEFYNEVSNRYNEYVEYLKQVGEYDLEVEAMDLQAETIASQVVIVGKGGQSAFGEDSILETVNANVLKKPFTPTELRNLVTEALQGKDPKDLQQEISNDFRAYIDNKLKKELSDNETTYKLLIEGVPTERKLLKLLEKEGHSAYEEAIKVREKELQTAQLTAEEKIRKSLGNHLQYISGIFDFFYIGQGLQYPVISYDAGQELVYAVFLGFIIDKKKPNPYTPSAVRLRFAIANSNKYIVIPASYIKEVNAIKGASIGVHNYGTDATESKWDAAIKESTVDRKVRYIVTGNLLQAFSAYRGKLVSYTTIEGAVKKGILMADSWIPGGEGSQKVNVPIGRALKIIRSLTTGGQITTNNNVSFFKQEGKFRIIVSSSRSQAGDVFLDPDILSLVDKNIFEKISNKMAAEFDEKHIEKIVNILQDKFSDSVSLKMDQFNIIKNDIPKKPVRENIIMVVQRKQSAPAIKPKVNELELEALALELELELLNFAA